MLTQEEMGFLMAARILAGEASSEEVQLHQAKIAEQPGYQQEWVELVRAWNLGTFAVCHDSLDVDNAYNSVKMQLNERKNFKKRHIPLFGYAASIAAIAVILIGLFWFLSPAGVENSYELVVQNSLKEEVVLSDGSLVSLNFDSKLNCVQPFSGNERRVKFSGEGYFEVTSDESNPFIVETGDVLVKVLGTAFNVRAYEELNELNIDVSSGLVEVHIQNPQLGVVRLEEGDGLMINKSTGQLQKYRSGPNVLSWKTGEIRFYDSALSEVIGTISKVYRVPVRVTDDSILDEKMGAAFSQNSLVHIMNVVCLTFNLEQEEINGEIVLSRKLTD